MRSIYDGLMGPIKEKNATNVPAFGDDEIESIVSSGMGLTAVEFETACARALVIHRKDLPRVNFDSYKKVVLDIKTEAIKKTECLEVMPTENMDNVGGLENLKEWITKRRHCFGEDARKFGIDPLKGIMLAGPPGTGKSLAAKSIASVFSIPLIKFDLTRKR